MRNYEQYTHVIPSEADAHLSSTHLTPKLARILFLQQRYDFNIVRGSVASVQEVAFLSRYRARQLSRRPKKRSNS